MLRSTSMANASRVHSSSMVRTFDVHAKAFPSQQRPNPTNRSCNAGREMTWRAGHALRLRILPRATASFRKIRSSSSSVVESPVSRGSPGSITFPATANALDVDEIFVRCFRESTSCGAPERESRVSGCMVRWGGVLLRI